MAKTIFTVLIDKYSERIASATEFIVDGGCKDHAHYRNVCGVIQGLNAAIMEVRDLSRNYMDEDND
tara:strand:- start:13618 stop:13815 length:198 start_codon:yes stop_codon:yes gene_type:complete